MNRVLAFVKLGRPRFLMGGVVLHTAGALHSVHSREEFDLRAFILGQCAITATQLMTHYSNDYFDVESDRLNRSFTMWSGGSRVLVDGTLSPHIARNAAIAFGVIATLIDLTILHTYGAARLGAFCMLVAALILSLGYSAPPLRLHSRGYGAITAAIVVGGLTPLVGFAMQSHGTLSQSIVRDVIPLMLAQVALILVLDLPDRASDEAAQKKTLAVRIGNEKTSRLAIALVLVTYAVAVVASSSRLTTLTTLFTLPVGASLIIALAKKMWCANRASSLTFRAVAWFATLSIALLVSGLRWPAY